MRLTSNESDIVKRLALVSLLDPIQFVLAIAYESKASGRGLGEVTDEMKTLKAKLEKYCQQ